MSTRRLGALLSLCLLPLSATFAAPPDGKAVFEKQCATCHASGAVRAPSMETLQAMTPARIVRALNTGAMRIIGTFNLTGPQRVAVAEYITGKTFDPSWRPVTTNPCAPATWPEGNVFARPHWNGWGVDQANTRLQHASMANLPPEDVSRLELKWAFAYPGETFTESQPAVVGGRLFAGSPSGQVYALDAKSGCTAWVFQADAPVKAPVVLGSAGGDGKLMVFFGDQSARVYAVDAASGKLVWEAQADDHPAARITGAAQIFEGRVYVGVSSLEEGLAADPNYQCCRFRGSVQAYDAATGKRLWTRYTIEETPAEHGEPRKNGKPEMGPSGASVWSALTIDPKLRRIYAGTGDNYSQPATKTSDGIMAIAIDTGETVWTYQGLAGDAWNIGCMTEPQHNCPKDEGPDQDMGASPIVTTLANGQRVVIGAQKSGYMHVLDADQNGKLLWKKKLAEGGVQGGLQWGQATDGETFYAAVSDVRWLTKQVVIASPKLDPRHGGGLVAVDLVTGRERWRAPPVTCGGRPKCSPAQTAAVTLIPGVVFSGSQSGELRAFATNDGKLLWKYDTLRSFKTVNGAPGRGGSLDQAGPVVVDGWLYVNSGYSKWGANPGNVVLAFGPRGMN
ncbi:MAG: PQQ-binding-like beta-propeller repeat protein [Gammaproteobacteria bacterium]|nr:PQQ-binding-like beta-propeller repeat protein [Gammaproteobacteria bacterium]MBI5616280.1 PQQ-binding-like beta-propeller repeat protein [Gammaproteobacteria bacterium]